MPESLRMIIYFLSAFISLFVFAYGGYYFVVSIFGWSDRQTNVMPKTNKIHTFALLVVAHNEEAVIGEMVKSLFKLHYPKEAFDVYVIADNCTDATAEVARNAGAYVYERTNATLKGKGHALEWMFDKIFKMDKKYDSISIFDADNLVSQNYLTEMNKELNKGYDVVQGSVDSKNPFDSWVTCAYSVSFWMISRLFQNARYNLGITCQLSGTGFVISTELLKEMGWGATCLTEDMEFTAKLALTGRKVGWAHKAVVYDEKPLTFMQSWHQRIRWMQGHSDVASRFAKKLFIKAFKDKDLSAFDCGVYLLQPVKILCLLFATVMTWVKVTGVIDVFEISKAFGDPQLWSAVAVLQMMYIPFVITYEKRMINLRLIWCYVTFWLYSLTWIPITVIGWLKKDNKEWSHTKHTRSITLEELEEAEKIQNI